MKKGLFVVIEGAAGSGKSTQFGLLKKRLEERGLEVLSLKFPRYKTPAAYFVRQYLENNYGQANSVNPYKASVFFSLDRLDAKKQIDEALDQGKVVLCDRYIASNMGYQGAKIEEGKERQAYFQWLYDFEFETLGIPKPDLNIFLYVPAKSAYELIEKRVNEEGGAGFDSHETCLEDIEKQVETYQEINRLFPEQFKLIDCTQKKELLAIEPISKIIWQEIEELI